MPAAFYNGLRDVLRKHLQEVNRGIEIAADADPGVLRIQNSTANPLKVGDVVGLGDPLVKPAGGTQAMRPTFVARVPTVDDSLRFGIVTQPATPGGVGRAVIVGAATATVTIVDEADTYARVQVSSVALLSTSDVSPARIIWKQAIADRASPAVAKCVVMITQVEDIPAVPPAIDVVLGTITAASVVGTGLASTINYSCSAGALSLTGAVPYFRPASDDGTDGDFPMRAAAVGSTCMMGEVNNEAALLVAAEAIIGEACTT